MMENKLKRNKSLILDENQVSYMAVLSHALNGSVPKCRIPGL